MAAWRAGSLAGLLAVFTASSLMGAAPRRVLVLHSYGQDLGPLRAISLSFHTELGQQLGEEVDFSDVALESARFQGAASEEPLVHYITVLFTEHPPDLVVTIAGPAARFAQNHRKELFPDVPLLLAAVDVRHVQKSALGTNGTVVGVTNDPALVLRGILEVLPATTNVAIVIGNSPHEKFWLGQIKEEFEPFTNRVNFIWFDRLSLAEMLRRAATLPPRSAIFYNLFNVDGEGVLYAEERVLHALHLRANAPIFGLHDTQMGLGVVGGPLMGIEEVSRTAAAVAVRILRGEPAGRIATPVQFPGPYVYDWRELRRWGIGEAQLPRGSLVRFRQPSFWKRHWPQVIAVGSFCLLETMLIIWLLIAQARRRQAEAEARQQREELAHVSRVSAMGELAASVAHELNQPLGAILGNADAADLFLKEDPPDLEELRVTLADIRQDGVRAGEVIRRMRNLLRKHRLEYQPLAVNTVVEEVLRLVRADAALREMTLAAELSPDLPLIRGDRIHLQQVLLNLILNGLEAMSKQPQPKRQLTVRTHRNNGSVEITVMDTGPGVAPADLPHLFDPFFTTKANGIGMGLSICRKIVEAHHGKIRAENDSAAGAVFHVSLPLANPAEAPAHVLH